MMSAADLLTSHRIKLESIAPGRHYTTCPHCSTTRKPGNQNKKTLGVTINGEGTHWGCNHCGWTGPEKGTSNGHGGDSLITYDYEDASGVVVFQKVRAYDKSGKKFFWLRHPDGRGGWSKGTKGVDTSLIYRLPEVTEAMALDRTILVLEGEKDSNRAWSLGIPATCNAHGAPDVIQNPNPAPKWKREHSEQLRGADLVIVPDNDPPGRYHAESIARLSHGIAKRIRVLDLALHWDAIPNGGDVSDYLDAGHSREQLDALIEQAPTWAPQAETREKAANGQDQHGDASPELVRIDLAKYDTEPIPDREWGVRDRFPRRAVCLLSGEGAVGKSMLLLQLSAAHVLGRDWLRSLPEQGPVLLVNCEDEGDELVRRLDPILKSHHAKFSDVAAGLHIFSLANHDPLLALPDRSGRSGRIVPTPLYTKLLELARTVQPICIVIDNVADVFGGSEIDRSQVRQFVALMRQIAIAADGYVIMSSHPSLAGIASKTGLSGSTQWHNSVRARAYMHIENDDQSGTRVLEFMKSNYSALSERVELQWSNGLYVPVRIPSAPEQAATRAKADAMFLSLLGKFTRKGENVSAKSRANNYGPTLFARTAEAKAAHLKRDDFAEALDRLIAADQVFAEPYGSPTDDTRRLVRRPL